ncbi:hypothetical protein FDH89_gp52 [Pseudomonas phage phiR18]|uniref:Uncharacterized protein n=1 Tax=Pseudomonas phage phiR18 TaxID=1752027 RepID=A0A0S3UFU4_9CAUD|nr:hypothetical protein FDH89_gp52 [Pseudomonas phage phiR18]BAU16380.1 hypothetical protein [Pseudomonas phage phiR18]
MLAKKRDRILANQTPHARKVYECVPIAEPWPAHQIMAQLKVDRGSALSVAVVRGCLKALHEAGLIRRPTSDLYIREKVTESSTATATELMDETVADYKDRTKQVQPAQPAQPKEPSMSTSIDTLLKIAQQLSVLAAEVEEKLSEIASEIETAAKQVESTTATDREQLAKLKQLQSLLKDL